MTVSRSKDFADRRPNCFQWPFTCQSNSNIQVTIEDRLPTDDVDHVDLSSGSDCQQNLIAQRSAVMKPLTSVCKCQQVF
jgi:hypothetical protein